MFSSIPTERRNVEFKLDVTHCFKGWKITKPWACCFGDALEVESGSGSDGSGGSENWK